jgi:hypothetical protein
MWNWLKAAKAVHAILVVLAAIGFFRFLVRTRFWFPRYVHWMAMIALGVGVGVLALIPAEAPMNQGGWIGFKRALVVLLFPGIVYVTFVFYGGQQAAYAARRHKGAVMCPHCREAAGCPGEPCGRCGQTIAP